MKMREIEFRGLTANGEWVYGDLLHDVEHSTAYWKAYSCRICWIKEKTRYCNTPVKNGTIGQYINLKDKTRKKIYEGDIVKKKKKIGRVLYHRWTVGFYASTKGGTMEIDDECEVIGDIHTTPELLEDKKKDEQRI